MVISVSVIILLAGCTTPSTTSTVSPTLIPTTVVITPEAKDVMVKTISAMNQITTFKLDSDITNTYHVNSGNYSGGSGYEWKGSKIVSLPVKNMQINMKVDSYRSDPDSAALKRTDSTAFEMYFYNGWQYFNITIPESYSGWHKTPFTISQSYNGWSKTHSDDWWNFELQTPELTQILTNAQSANVSGNEIVNGVDCFILNITPTTSDAADWIFSQYQPIGPAKVSTGPTLPYDDTTNKGVMFKFWISKTSYLILKVEADVLFAGEINTSINGGPLSSTTPKQKVSIQYSGQMIFSGYNEPVSIKPPPEALSAPGN
jgi:hypothetical protein